MHAQAALQVADMREGRVFGWTQTVPRSHLPGAYIDGQAQGELTERCSVGIPIPDDITTLTYPGIYVHLLKVVSDP